MITALILIHYAAAIFYAGMYFKDNFEWCETMRAKIVTISVSLIIIIFGASLLIIPISGFIWYRIDKYFSLTFFVRWYFLGKLLNYSKDDIDEMNGLAEKMGNKLQDRIQKYAIRIINDNVKL